MRKNILSVEVGTKIGDIEILSINYELDSPYRISIKGEETIVSMKKLRELVYSDLSPEGVFDCEPYEGLMPKPLIEDYNMPYDFYCNHIGITKYNCNSEKVAKRVKEFKDNCQKDCEDEDRCISGIETPYIDIELGLYKECESRNFYASYTICINTYQNKNTPVWDTFNSIIEDVRLTSITTELTNEAIAREYYKILMKHAKKNGLFVSQYN